MKLISITNRDPRFYKIMGPFLSRRDIVREMGHPIWDDDNKRWIVAMSLSDGAVLGFCAALFRGVMVELCSDYVLPSHRGRGIYSAMFARRIEVVAGREMRAVATSKSVGMFMRHGFRCTGARGKYRVMTRAAA